MADKGFFKFDVPISWLGVISHDRYSLPGRLQESILGSTFGWLGAIYTRFTTGGRMWRRVRTSRFGESDLVKSVVAYYSSTSFVANLNPHDTIEDSYPVET